MTAQIPATRTVAVVAFLWGMGLIGAGPTQAGDHGHGHHHDHHHHGHHGHFHAYYHGGYCPRPYYAPPVVVVAPRPVYVPPPRVHYHPEYHIDGLMWSPGRGVGLTGHYDLVPHYGW